MITATEGSTHAGDEDDGASSNGASYAVTATNESELVLTVEGQGWAASALTIGYDDDRGDHWTLAIEPTQWH